MKENVRLFPSSIAEERNKIYLKAVWIAFFLLALLISVQANQGENMAINEQVNNQIENEEQQAGKTITGVVSDSDGNVLPGVTVYIKGTTNGAVTNFNGEFSIRSENEDDILVLSFVGMKIKEFPVAGLTNLTVMLESSTEVMDDIVIVGYGVQKKESIVGAITSAKGEDLLKAGGVTNVGEALQGRLPGVTAISSSGLPGESDPKIFIRGQSSWNGSGQPLILVDGVERSMSDIDLNEIDQMSVLKDASATAVFGVKGANGVILIKTKRGMIGKSQLSLSANSTIKTVSKLPEKLDSYDAIMVANEAIMREVMYAPEAWNSFRPMGIADKYLNPASLEESYQYANVDWTDEVLKDFAMDHRVNLSVRGGTEFVKYFGSLSYQAVSDIFNADKYPNNKGYSSGYTYNRFNYRSNLDFNITKTTKVAVNLSGFYGTREEPYDDLRLIVNSIYTLAPSVYTPVYPDGYYGMHISDSWGLKNPVVKLTNTGNTTYNKVQINSDFILDQKLDFLTKGLSLKAKVSFDNDMTIRQQLSDEALSASYDNVIYRIYDGEEEIIASASGVNDFDFVVKPWILGNAQVRNNTRLRRLNYELSLNYNRIFAEKHNVTALFLMKREEFAIGNMFPRFREDWVGRLTYNYDSKYFLDVNGAYNGSEKFGPGYRFDLFPSAALGWMISNEAFMSAFEGLDKLKIRGSYGLVGDDNFSGRWKYMTQWGTSSISSTTGTPRGAYLVPSNIEQRSPYGWYRELSVGNPELHWETAVKSNLGLEVSLWENMITADIDFFREDRDNILISGSQRSVPDWYGIDPPDANSGQVEVKGYEVVLKFKYDFNNGIHAWVNGNYTNAKDKIIFKEDPALLPSYQKEEGFPIGQTRLPIKADLMSSWDDIYMSTPTISDQEFRRLGYYDLVDFNADGIYDNTYDRAPYGYTNRPERTWNLTLGSRYKGFSVMVQLYGAQNATKYYQSRAFYYQTDLFYAHSLGYWSKDNPSGTSALKPWSLTQASDDPDLDYFDASLLRLKTVEISYDIPKHVCKKIGVSGLRVFANGNNLYLWTHLPDDREFNGNNTEQSQYFGDYPTMKRFNFGLNLNF